MRSVELEDLVKRLSLKQRTQLVAHRGFHSPKDDLSRPLENTMSSLQTAWDAGMELCECDVTHSVDGDVFFSHDDTFERLGVENFSDGKDLIRQPVKSLTSEEVESIQLKDGSSPLRLEDALNTLFFSESSGKLVIEVKTSADSEIVSISIMKLLLKVSVGSLERVRSKVPVIMSFNLKTMVSFAEKFGSLGVSKTERPTLMVLVECLKDNLKLQGLKDGSFDFDFNEENVVKTLKQNLLLPDESGEFLLDGIYMEFQQGMLEEGSQMRRNLELLSEICTVGVFFQKNQPDKNVICSSVLSTGVSFVNTDLPKPKDFFY